MQITPQNRRLETEYSSPNKSRTDNNKEGLPGTAKTNSKEDYLSSLRNKYPDANINMGSSYVFNGNSLATLNISPKYLEKGLKDPEVAEKIENLASSLVNTFPQYLSTHNTLPDGRTVTNVSFVVDENGGVSCTCKYDNKTSGEPEDPLSLLERLRLKREEREEKAEMSAGNDITRAYKDSPVVNFLNTTV